MTTGLIGAVVFPSDMGSPPLPAKGRGLSYVQGESINMPPSMFHIPGPANIQPSLLLLPSCLPLGLPFSGAKLYDPKIASGLVIKLALFTHPPSPRLKGEIERLLQGYKPPQCCCF